VVGACEWSTRGKGHDQETRGAGGVRGGGGCGTMVKRKATGRRDVGEIVVT